MQSTGITERKQTVRQCGAHLCAFLRGFLSLRFICCTNAFFKTNAWMRSLASCLQLSIFVNLWETMVKSILKILLSRLRQLLPPVNKHRGCNNIISILPKFKHKLYKTPSGINDHMNFHFYEFHTLKYHETVRSLEPFVGPNQVPAADTWSLFLQPVSVECHQRNIASLSACAFSRNDWRASIMHSILYVQWSDGYSVINWQLNLWPERRIIPTVSESICQQFMMLRIGLIWLSAARIGVLPDAELCLLPRIRECNWLGQCSCRFKKLFVALKSFECVRSRWKRVHFERIDRENVVAVQWILRRHSGHTLTVPWRETYRRHADAIIRPCLLYSTVAKTDRGFLLVIRVSAVSQPVVKL